jgi:hypothetical protein
MPLVVEPEAADADHERPLQVVEVVVEGRDEMPGDLPEKDAGTIFKGVGRNFSTLLL